MKLKDLQKIDPDLKLAKNSEWPEEILAICTFEALTDKGLLFIKNAKFMQKLLPHAEQVKKLNIGAVVDEFLFENANAQLKELFEKLAWVATTKQVALSLTLLSKPFYDKKFAGINTQVDGRQMGTVDIDPSAYIAQNVFIGENVKIGANVEIMPGAVILPQVSIAENTKIYPNVTIYPFTQIGKSCRIHAGSVIGGDGFGYTFNKGRHHKIWHMGGVNIGDDVEIGSNSAVDMGTFSPTIVGAGSRIDNFVQIAHNTKIGKGCVLCGHCAIAGSAVLEDFVVMGGKAAIGPEAHIGMGSQIAGGALVNEGAIWPAGSKLGGHPARDLKEWMKGFAYVRKMSLKENK